MTDRTIWISAHRDAVSLRLLMVMMMMMVLLVTPTRDKQCFFLSSESVPPILCLFPMDWSGGCIRIQKRNKKKTQLEWLWRSVPLFWRWRNPPVPLFMYSQTNFACVWLLIDCFLTSSSFCPCSFIQCLREPISEEKISLFSWANASTNLWKTNRRRVDNNYHLKASLLPSQAAC